MKKTPIEIDKEINDFVKTLPVAKPEELKVSDLFVVAQKNYQYCFGHKNSVIFAVVSKTKTLIRATMACDAPNGEVIPSTMFDTFTFKGCARDLVVLRRASKAEADHVKSLMSAKDDAEWFRNQREKNKRDVYVLWNYASEDCGAAELRAFSWIEQRQGFVLEVYNGNGKLLERVRMLTNVDASMECADGDAVKRMVCAYVGCHFSHDAVRSGAKFQIHQVPEMD